MNPLAGRSEACSQEGSRDYQDSAPETLLRPRWWEGRGYPEDTFEALEAWVPASWGSPRPHQGWALLGAPSPPAVAVSVYVPLGIRELLAAPTDILLLT